MKYTIIRNLVSTNEGTDLQYCNFSHYLEEHSSHQTIVSYFFADLQNPLLKKYNFSAKEFAEGSKEAFSQVHLAIASVSFSNFVNGYEDSVCYLLDIYYSTVIISNCSIVDDLSQMVS